MKQTCYLLMEFVGRSQKDVVEAVTEALGANPRRVNAITLSDEPLMGVEDELELIVDGTLTDISSRLRAAGLRMHVGLELPPRLADAPFDTLSRFAAVGTPSAAA